MKAGTIVVLFFCLCTGAIVSQTDSTKSKVKLKNPKWQLGLDFSTVEPITEAGFMYAVSQPSIFNDATTHRESRSFSIGLSGSRSVNDDCVLRFLARSTQYRIYERYDSRESTTSGSSPYILDTARVTQTVYGISAAVFWTAGYKRLHFCGGFQVVYRNYGSMNLDLKYAFYEASNDSLTLNKFYTIREGGGYSIGLGPVIGFSVELGKGISIGSEFSTAYSYYKRGGKTSLVETRTYPVVFVANTQDSRGSYQAFKFSSILSSVNISYSF